MSITKGFTAEVKESSEATSTPGEKVFLVGAELKSRTQGNIAESLEELASLAETAGGEVVGEGTQKLDKPLASTFISKGKAKQFAAECQDKHVDTVIFDDELTPGQGRNLAQVFDCKIIDRTSLILDIFAQRARTREGKLQVELAQLQHLLPQLTRFWTHLSRQKGGIGMRGDGESQLETDRRRIQERIGRLSTKLEQIRKHRAVQRQRRRRHNWPLASIVGYTNAGKSTLLNQLTGAGVQAEDHLFATLDPTTRRIKLETNQKVLLSDTVGFIRKLPHRLVEAFKATLEEVAQSDLLLHVVDISHPQARLQIEAVNQVLEEIHAHEKPTLMVFNKIDQLDAPGLLDQYLHNYSPAVGIAAATGLGFDSLKAHLSTCLRPIRAALRLSVPVAQTSIIARIHEVGQVVALDYKDNYAEIEARIPPHCLNEFQRYAC
ncbi:MAG: GTPase HflX [Verrucomicrobia subdivision 3 bacterium]|nr:GTPase HflX [Limisphaerales bacterium]MCS1414753.1 GTPase HflX [Limisphaerales bacterium]